MSRRRSGTTKMSMPSASVVSFRLEVEGHDDSQVVLGLNVFDAWTVSAP